MIPLQLARLPEAGDAAPDAGGDSVDGVAATWITLAELDADGFAGSPFPIQLPAPRTMMRVGSPAPPSRARNPDLSEIRAILCAPVCAPADRFGAPSAPVARVGRAPVARMRSFHATLRLAGSGLVGDRGGAVVQGAVRPGGCCTRDELIAEGLPRRRTLRLLWPLADPLLDQHPRAARA